MFFLSFVGPFHAGEEVSCAQICLNSRECLKSLCSSTPYRSSLLRHSSLEKRSAKHFVKYFDDLDEDSLKYSGTFMTSVPEMYRERSRGDRVGMWEHTAQLMYG